MTREAAQKHKASIKAFISGEDIEFYNKDKDEWEDTTMPAFNHSNEYRVKVKSELIPLDPTDGPRIVGAIIRHKIATENIYSILAVGGGNIFVYDKPLTYKMLF